MLERILMGAALTIDTLLATYNISIRLLLNEPEMAMTNLLGYLAKIDQAPDGKSTQGILKVTNYFKHIASDNPSHEILSGRLGWFGRKFSKTIEKASRLGASVSNRMMQSEKFVAGVQTVETAARAVEAIDYDMLKEVQKHQIKRDSECAIEDALHPSQKAKSSRGSSTNNKTGNESLHERMCAMVESVNSRFVEKIVSGEFADIGVSLNNEECEDNFRASKNDIAMILASDSHFRNHTFDDMDFNSIHEIVINDILRMHNPGAYIVGSRYMADLLERIKEEFN